MTKCSSIILDEGAIVADGSADKLAREVAGKTEVIWTQNGERHVHAEKDATNFVRRLLTDHPKGISQLEVRRASLEDTYMMIVQRKENQDEKEAK